MTELSLEIVEGPGTGLVFALTASTEIGSGPSAGLRLDDPQVTDPHARVSPAEGGALVEDLGEPGGTFVNDSELHAPTRIKPGDEIQVGVTMLQLHAGTSLPRRPQPPPLAAPDRRPEYLPPAVMEQDPDMRHLDALLDATTKTKARVAPLAIFVVVVFAVLIFLATAKI
jgi:predicted component of type VI protein secretion system